MLNVIYDMLQSIGNLLYVIYETLMLGGIFILFPLEDKHTKILLHKSSIKACNTFCKDVCFDISWKMCEMVTIVQTSYRKTIIPNFHRITDNYFRNRNTVLLIKNGEEIEQFKTWQLFEQEKENIDFDLILYTKYNEVEQKKNYTFIRDKSLPSFRSPPDSLLNNKCDVSFIVFQLTTDGNKYDIELKDNRNFFVKDNVLKYPFFKWYMKRVYDVILSEDFSVNYMTNDMSMATLHNPFFIKFNEDGVTSFSSGKPKVVSIEKDEEGKEEEEEEEKEEEEEALSNEYTDTDTDTDTDIDVDTEYIEDPQPSADTDIMISERFKHHLE